MKKVLIIGSGIAGLSCAVTNADGGNKVFLVSPFPSERSQSVMAAGGMNAVDLDGQDSVDRHTQDTLKGGCFLENKDDVRRMCEEAPKIVSWLEKNGVQFTRDDNGRVSRRILGGHSCQRTAFAKSSTGKQIVTGLVQKVRKFEIEGKIERILGLRFYSALIRDGKCFGAVFYDEHSQSLKTIYADAVVMAVGGLNQIFGKTTGSALCDGYAAGRLMEQGVEMRNLEFIQYHPTTIETAHKRMLISEAARGEGGRLFYYDGDRRVYFMEDRFGPKGNLMPRDVVSKCIYDVPAQVYLDISFLGEKTIHRKLEEIYDICKKYMDLDVTKEPIPVYPSVHFFMGGIRVDRYHRTNIENLFAVGECASKYHGANRLGGNSLLAAMYSGKTAGDYLTENLEENAAKPDFDDELRNYAAAFAQRSETKSQFPADFLQKELAKIMNRDLGIVRNETKLKEGLETVNFYLNAAKKIQFDPDVSLYQGYRIYHMLLLSKAMLLSALSRQESRGSHIRSDYPELSRDLPQETIAWFDNGEVKTRMEKIS